MTTTAVTVLPTSPRIQINAQYNAILSNIFDVFFSTESVPNSNSFTRVTAILNLTTAGSSDWDQIIEIMKYCGVTPASYEGWLSSTQKDVAVKALAKWVTDVLIPKIVAIVNNLVAAPAVTPPAPTTGNFATTLELMQGLIGSIKWTVNPTTGKVSGTV